MDSDPGETRSSLVRRLGDLRDDDAWREFDRRYQRLIVRYCQRRGLQIADAEDVRQAVMINVGRAMRGFSYDRSRGRFRAYLGRAVQNAVSRFLAGRHAGIRFADLDAASTAASEPEDERWLDEWRSHHLHLALETLKASVEPRSLQVFERLLDGSTAAEIATSFGMSEEAVHKVRQRMRDRLRDLVVEQVRDEESGQSDAQ